MEIILLVNNISTLVVLLFVFWMYTRKSKECQKISILGVMVSEKYKKVSAQHIMVVSKAEDVVKDFVEDRDLSLNMGQLNGLLISLLEDDDDKHVC